MDSIYHEIFKKWKLSNPYLVHRYFVKWYRLCFFAFVCVFPFSLVYRWLQSSFYIESKSDTRKKKINESKFAKRKIIWHKWKESWFLISDLCESTKYILVASVFCFWYFFFILSFKGAWCLWIKIHKVRVWGVFSFSYLLFHFIRHEFSIFIFFLVSLLPFCVAEHRWCSCSDVSPAESFLIYFLFNFFFPFWWKFVH